MACKKGRQSPKFYVPDHENNFTYLKFELVGKAGVLCLFKVYQGFSQANLLYCNNDVN